VTRSRSIGPDDALGQSLRDLPSPAPPPMGDALAAELSSMSPVAPRRPRRDLARVAAVSLVYGAILLVLFDLRRDLPGLPVARVVAIAVAWLAAFGALLWLAIVPRSGSVMPRWRAAGAGAIVASLLFVAVGFLVPPHGDDSTYLGLAHLPQGHRCLEYGLATAMVPAVLGALVLRGAVPVGSRWVAAALGAAGGSLGGFVLHLHCSVSDGWHVGLVHGGVVAASAALAAVLAPRRLER
jgi:hypothetical protein